MAIWFCLPEWARWILCWPVLAISWIIMIFLSQFIETMSYGLGNPSALIKYTAPIYANLMALPLFLYAVRYFIPRKQHYFVLAWCVFIALILLLNLNYFIQDIINDYEGVWDMLKNLIWSGLSLLVSVVMYHKIKKEVQQDEKREARYRL